MPDESPAKQYASNYADQIVKVLDFEDRDDSLPITRDTLQAYLQIAFNAGTQHAADNYMRMQLAPGTERASLGIDTPRNLIPHDPQDDEPENPERDRLLELMDQVAREAIVTMNTEAQEPERTLCVFPNGSWEFVYNNMARHYKPIVIKLPVKHYEDAEALAIALQALVSA